MFVFKDYSNNLSLIFSSWAPNHHGGTAEPKLEHHHSKKQKNKLSSQKSPLHHSPNTKEGFFFLYNQ